jgi:serine/arginine repetitive matrix protein 2
MEQPTAAEQREQRAFLAAKLKRAASLPRMKDGRRPPMHVDGVSEGESEKRDEHNELDTPPADGQDQAGGSPDVKNADVPSTSSTAIEFQAEILPPRPPTAEPERPTTTEPQTDPESLLAVPAEPSADFEADPDQDAEEPAKAKKRRRRSRSRSRGSKDWKKAAPVGISPAPSPAINGNDSSPEQVPSQLPQLNPFQIPTVISPIPSHFAAQFQRRAASPTAMFYPGTSPSTPLPSLDQLHGLIRSNSAAARMMAMSKLTANQGNERPYSPSPTPDTLRALGRNNTVTYGERSAARNLMMGRLKNRLNPDASGGEDVTNVSAPPTRSPTPKRRRSRKPSISTSTVVDDRELSSTAPNTPVAPPSPMLASGDEKLAALPMPSPFATPNVRQISLERERQDTLAKLVGSPTMEYTPSPRNRRSVVVEDDDGPDPEVPMVVEPLFSGLPPPPPIPNHVTGPRMTHSSDAPSSVSTESGGAIALPVFLAEKTVYKEDLFPTSPFNTPLKEKPSMDEEEEEFLFQSYQSGLDKLVPHRGQMDRSLSWVEEPSTSSDLCFILLDSPRV